MECWKKQNAKDPQGDHKGQYISNKDTCLDMFVERPGEGSLARASLATTFQVGRHFKRHVVARLALARLHIDLCLTIALI